MINNSLFKIEIPNLNPIMDEYEHYNFWKGVKKKIIEGDRVSGKWMPGPLWYASNFHKIPLEEDGANQKIGLTLVRDIDWEIYYMYEEARGLSGFIGCDFSANRLLTEELNDEELKSKCYFGGKLLEGLHDNLFDKKGKRKKYKPAKELINSLLSNVSHPIYYNEAKNVQIMGARGGGKTVWASAFASHNILTSGANNYEAYLKSIEEKNRMKSTTLISSWETKFVEVINGYIKFGIENIEGDIYYNNEIYPSPIKQGYAVGSDWKIGAAGGVKFNSGNVLVSRVFTDSALSSNSGRPNLTIIDEYAFVKNIKAVIASIEGSSASKRRKNNVIWMIATGGLSGSGDSLRYAEDMFYNPDAFNCLSFKDDWENRKNIGYFLPITKSSMKYKEGENFITNEVLAFKHQKEERSKASHDKQAYKGYIINNPLVPSECFLLPDNDIFPTMLLKQQYTEHVESGGRFSKQLDASYKGHFIQTNDGVDFVVTNETPIREYPLSGVSNYLKKGCVEIWQKPVKGEDDTIERGRYIGSADVVRKDIATSSESLPSLFIMDRHTEQIVAEYTGRTDRTVDFYEQSLFAAIYFNAVILYENNIDAMFTYFDQKRALHYLADTPYQLRSREEPFVVGTNSSKGMRADIGRNQTGIHWISDWMLSPSKTTDGQLQLNHIHSLALLLECIKKTDDNNTDRVSSLIILMWYKNTLKQVEKENRVEKLNTFTSMYLNRSKTFFKS